MSTQPRILIIGANGQIGTELAEALAQRHGPAAVVTSDLAPQGRLPALRHEALEWATTRGGRSGRVAWQYIQDAAGRLRKPLNR